MCDTFILIVEYGILGVVALTFLFLIWGIGAVPLGLW